MRRRFFTLQGKCWNARATLVARLAIEAELLELSLWYFLIYRIFLVFPNEWWLCHCTDQVTRKFACTPLARCSGRETPACLRSKMSDPRSQVLPPPPPTIEDAGQVVGPSIPTSAQPRPKPSRSIKDFFGGKSQTPTFVHEQDSGSAVNTTSANHEVTSDRDTSEMKTVDGEEDTGLDADTSINSIVVVESTGSKRKAGAAAQGKAVASTTGKKRTKSKKVTDEDAEMKAMAAAAKKKQKVTAKTASRKSKIVDVEELQDGVPGASNGECRSPVVAAKTKTELELTRTSSRICLKHATLKSTQETRPTEKAGTCRSRTRSNRYFIPGKEETAW